MNAGLERLNALTSEGAEAEFLSCCGSTNWTRKMADARPFQNEQGLLVNAERIWWSLDESDWLEAFSRHPKIGEKKAAVAQDAEAARWSEEEQSGTHTASRDALSELAEANRAYEQKFGYIFIICATGKNSLEMLENLRKRLENDPQTEIRIAAEEQLKITHLRLRKLLER